MRHENSPESLQGQVKKGKPFSYRRKVWEILSQRTEPMTDREIIETLHEQDVNNVRPEITRLKQDQLIMEVGKKKCPVTGKPVRLVRITGRPFFQRRAKSLKTAETIAARPTQGVLFQ